MKELRKVTENLRAKASSFDPHDEGTRAGGPELDVEFLMEQMRAETVSGRSESSAAISAGAVPRVLSPVALREEYAIDELLAYDGEEFVRNAYRALLRREPDEGGLLQNLAGLEGGHTTKVDVLGGLASSPQGRAAGIRVHGLARAFFVRRLCRLPVIGFFFNLVHHAARLPLVVRDFERQRAALSVRERELRASIQSLVRSEMAKVATELATRPTYREVAELGDSALEAVSRVEAAVADLEQARARTR